MTESQGAREADLRQRASGGDEPARTEAGRKMGVQTGRPTQHQAAFLGVMDRAQGRTCAIFDGETVGEPAT